MQSSYVHTIDHTIYTAWQVHLWNSLTFSLKTSLWPTRSGLWLVFHLFSHDFSSHSRFSSHMGLLAILPPCQAFSYLKDFVLTVSSVWNMLSYTFSWLVPSLHWDLCSNDTSSKRSSQQKTTHHFLAPHSAFFNNIYQHLWYIINWYISVSSLFSTRSSMRVGIFWLV